MSASLDDMPAYEHFQDELDLELARYAKTHALSDLYVENEFIQYICFSLFLTKPSELTSEILEHFLSEKPESRSAVETFILYMNDNDKSYLKNMFTNNFNFTSR
ncbi:hypothetical protein [Cytophaga aurantiaca]|uniref:hypothetical protein n=1 Tax=Cytophaga aurantiaca TaxID=29530 RepID=UPI0003648654|nr:hypothetical protein [Cytophaga aurantiaca]